MTEQQTETETTETETTETTEPETIELPFETVGPHDAEKPDDDSADEKPDAEDA